MDVTFTTALADMYINEGVTYQLKGFPLWFKVIGGRLFEKREENEWKYHNALLNHTLGLTVIKVGWL